MSNQQKHVPASALIFLKLLAQNNNRDWFNAHKEQFIEQQTYIEAFAGLLLAELNTHDVIETLSGKKSLYRIYRDTRFSTDKTPYKGGWSGNFKRATKLRRGGYYFHIEPGNNFVGGGFRNPNAADLKLIRNDIAFDDAPLRNILQSESFISTFNVLQGEQLKTVPQGFDANNAGIDLLRYKQFLLIRKFTDEEVLSSSFLKEASRTFKNMRPFFDYMSSVLTTDINGLEI
ncbi:DUF2461 domain-containing protein [Mucilaginibacter polytrichastri]|uniref:TIGR02453 family protein n=1 Tax=Mucilaginibacter polytrichastri TaxID=1302689 RepID=A0A1Q5ZUH8_9SPHI|nr:DUF2461 domain-containing protein [Mucilaginibacter polytrichastri]OKS85429.1 hypothetical protein RG47T_0875 [Mucilaginibacter polytrichastri]SFS39010.1 TIGR02453 family protein [Mucilaginibacter polytrichastri]